MCCVYAESVLHSFVSKFSGGRPGAIPITPFPELTARIAVVHTHTHTHTHAVEGNECQCVSVSASTNGKCFDDISP